MICPIMSKPVAVSNYIEMHWVDCVESNCALWKYYDRENCHCSLKYPSGR